MNETKFSSGGYTGKVNKESAVGIIHNTGCCFGFALDEKSTLNEIKQKSGQEIKTIIITINKDGVIESRGLSYE